MTQEDRLVDQGKELIDEENLAESVVDDLLPQRNDENSS